MRFVAALKVVTALVLSGAGASYADAQEPYWPTHGWRYSSPEAQGMDSEELVRAFEYVRDHQTPIHSLTIVRNGYVVLDAYFWPFQAGQLHDLASVTKSVTSTLVGIAIGRNELELRKPITSVFDQRVIGNLDERKKRVTIEHLLTMTYGSHCDASRGEITLSQMRRSADWTQFMLDLPMRDEPGSRFEYCSGGMHLLSAAITMATGLSALGYARRELFDPLGIGKAAWPADAHGVSYGWGDLHLEPLDMAKLGYLWLNNGRWQDRQLVPQAWMSAAVRAHSDQKYGYGLWLLPDRRPPLFEAIGRGGQRISVAPDKNVVVVFTGGEFEPGDIGAFILRAIKSDRPLPESPSATARLALAVEAAATPPRPVSFASPLAKTISGRRYTLTQNAIGLRSFVLKFSEAAVAELQFDLSDRIDPPRPVGLDGIPRVSPDGHLGSPVAVSGNWASDSTFVVEYNTVGNINTYRFRLRFYGDNVEVDLSERSGVIPTARFHGKTSGLSSSTPGR